MSGSHERIMDRRSKTQQAPSWMNSSNPHLKLGIGTVHRHHVGAERSRVFFGDGRYQDPIARDTTIMIDSCSGGLSSS